MSENIIKGLFKVKLSEKSSMMIARLVLIVISILSIIIAWNPDSSVFQIVSFAWAGFGATFGPVMLSALFWRRSNKYGAISGMVVGGVMVFVWKFILKPMGGVFGIYELLPAFVLATIAIVLVSLITEKPSQEITQEFDEVKAENKR
jgi:sodium/proline symporter